MNAGSSGNVSYSRGSIKCKSADILFYNKTNTIMWLLLKYKKNHAKYLPCESLISVLIFYKINVADESWLL